MAKELKAQTEIKASIRRDGGYSTKLSHRFSVGIPDLIIALHPFVPILCEVKDLGPVVDRFDRKLDVTPMQDETMRRMSEPYEKMLHPYTPNRRTACLLVAFIHRGVHTLVALQRDMERLTWQYDSLHPWTTRQTGLHYKVGPLLEGVGIAKVSVAL